MRLRTSVGEIELTVRYGYDPGADGWGSPIRQRWGLTAHQQLSPALQDKLAFTATHTGTYEQAAAVAGKWGSAVDPSTLHALVQRLGARAEEQTQLRLAQTPAEKEPRRAPTALAVLMLDGWQVRQRGPGWGKKKTKKPRVEWHELKTGVFYRQEQAVRAESSGRGQLTEKVVVSWQGPPLELGARLHHEALRGGLGRARAVQVVGDGAPWIWGVATDRWSQAHQLLDFYHASQHLWAVGQTLHGEGPEAEAWAHQRWHWLRHGQEKKVLAELQAMALPAGAAGEVVRREQNYFASHAHRMNYQETAARGWAIGSGAVESTCRERQCRYKRPGQFWTALGLRHLCGLEEARDNGHWEQLWLPA
jgi:hypothetical protein